jgi:alginate O-acetyltransferase complex protein AlgI
MIGFVIALHGGVFTLLTEFWRGRGHDVKPLMNCPIAAASVTEFWGKRWNLGFRDLAHTLIFKPLHRRFSQAIAISTVFLISGLAHELVITVPARGGYGGPTVYFLLQALCMALERGCPFRRNGIVWRIRAWISLVVPLPLLFPTVFVERVMQPFFTFIHALP